MKVLRFAGKSISAILSLTGTVLLVLSIPIGVMNVIMANDLGYTFLGPILLGGLGFSITAAVGLALLLIFLPFASPTLLKKLDTVIA